MTKSDARRVGSMRGRQPQPAVGRRACFVGVTLRAVHGTKTSTHGKERREGECDRRAGGLGFRPTTAAHDWIYDWPSEASVEDVLDFGDQIHAALAEMGVFFQMETV